MKFKHKQLLRYFILFFSLTMAWVNGVNAQTPGYITQDSSGNFEFSYFYDFSSSPSPDLTPSPSYGGSSSAGRSYLNEYHGNSPEEDRRIAEHSNQAAEIARKGNERDDTEKAEKRKQEEDRTRESEWNDSRKKREEEKEFKKHQEQFEPIKAGMVTNDAQLNAADKTHDLIERLRVRRDLIQKSGYAAELAGKLNSDKTAEYRNYQKRLERELPAIKADIYKKLDDYAKENAPNNAEIEAADRTHDLNKRLDARRKVIERIRTAADYAHKFTTIAGEAHDTMRLFRDYQHHIERQLPAIEKDLKKENRRKEKESQREAKKERERESKRLAKEEEKRQRTTKSEPGRQAKETRIKDEQVPGTQQPQVGESPILIGAFNAEQVAQGLSNMEAMFNGQIAPDMNLFNNLLNTLTGGETSIGSEHSLIRFERSMADNYIMTSCQYRDEKFGVTMDIGRVTKFENGQLDFDAVHIETMTLSGINVMQKTGKITFALTGGGENVMIESDLDSLRNYVAQKTIEERIYLRNAPDSIPNVDVDKLAIWGVDKGDGGRIRSIASVVADFLPYVGTAKVISELITGRDYIGGEDVSRIVAACGVIGSLVPIPGAGKAGKLIGKVVQSIGKNSIKFVGRIEKELISDLVTERILTNAAQGSNFERFIKRLPLNVAETSIHDLPDGGKVFQATISGRVPGSKAVYEKQIDSMGKTIQYTKTTYDPASQIVHVKDKITGKTI